MNRASFSAKIYKVGINPCVEVPQRVSKFFGKRGYVPVSGTLNGFPIRATLVPVGDGRHRLYINGVMCKGASVSVGDRIHLALGIDTKSRAVPMPKDFAKALNRNKAAKSAFEQMRPSCRKEILRYLNFLKTPESLQRNIEKVVASLNQGQSPWRGGR